MKNNMTVKFRILRETPCNNIAHKGWYTLYQASKTFHCFT